MVNVPLADAIRTLARESNLNYILDPHVPGSDFGPGRLTPKLSRIAPANLSVKPVPTSQVGTNTSSIIPLLVMDSVSLTEAVTQLARSASLAVSLDPKLSATAFDAQGTVSFRWERITARQALAALLDNYDLVMIEDRATSAARITQKSDPENERDVAVKKAKVWLTKNPALLKPGAAKSTNAPAFGPVTERATASAADEAAWGEPVEGVSVRLRADKIKWATNEIPTFKLDVRNQGQREFYTVQSQESGRLEVDGVWYDWTGPIDLKGSSLPPGREYHDIPVSLGSNWKATQEWRDKTQAPPPQIPLKLLPGKHTIRFAPEIRDITVKPKPQSNYVPSNPAEIEIISK